MKEKSFMYKMRLNDTVHKYLFICGIKILRDILIKEKCVNRLLKGLVIKNKMTEVGRATPL